MEAFYYEYYYPGLLKKILAGEKIQIPEKVVPFERKDIRQTEIRICQKCPCSANNSLSQNEILENDSTICLDILASPDFTTADFPRFNSLAQRLVDGKDAISQKIFMTFTPDLRNKLKSYTQSLAKNPNPAILQMMRQEMGNLLRQDDFFKNYQEFVKKSSPILELAKSNLQGNERGWLNRLLLEESLPEIRKGKISKWEIPDEKSVLASDYEPDQKGVCPKDELCLQDLRLFWNNRLIKRWSGDLLGKDKADCMQVSEYRIQCQRRVPVVEGIENKYSAYLFNQDRVKSTDGEIILR